MEPLTVNEAARRLSLSTKSVYELLRTGRLIGKRLGKQWRIAPSDLEALLLPTPSRSED